jgi:hypothetical protein
MQSISVRTRVGADGKLRLDIPVDVRNVDVEVVVVMQPASTPAGWPADFFERTAGALADTPIKRGEQGDFESRDVIK